MNKLPRKFTPLSQDTLTLNPRPVDEGECIVLKGHVPEDENDIEVSLHRFHIQASDHFKFELSILNALHLTDL